ncbi:MAG: ShlB/FhaC/HecB family hemolysin secretion/activation protein [Betaproteobacteria bacterium]|nr:ShlB/FhaC/HecB family hemolysin secretion/activation protein [Betaproteobacteria bacterium]
MHALRTTRGSTLIAGGRSARTALGALGFALANLLVAVPCGAQDERFDVVRFEIVGNTLLPQAELERAVAPMVGQRRVYGDLQKALEALERAYREAGYGTVQVYLPEQELSGGVVRIEVTESVIGKVAVSGNKYFDEANIRAALPALKEGKAPNLRALSEAVQLSNENPAKQVEVTLGVSEEEGKVDAKVVVTEEDPERIFVTLDGTGTEATGRARVGVAYQNANLLKLDHTLTLAYTTSPDAPSGVKVDIFSVGYRVPLYGIGDSVDFIYGKSSVNTPSTSPVLGGVLGIVGKGDVFGARWNHYFARRGEYSSKLIFGFDYKYVNSSCTVSGAPVDINPPTPPIASCLPYTTRPLSVTYAGQKQSPGRLFDYNIGLARNWALGTKYTSLDGTTDNYSYITSGNRRTRDDFTILRLGGSFLRAFEGDWQVRIAASGQRSADPLVAAEQFGLAGSTAVRGFAERAAASDSGYLFNLEGYSPELAKTVGLPGSLRAVAFYDFARGFNARAAGSSAAEEIGIASVGAGLRYALGKDLSVRFDLAQVLDAGPPNTKARGEWRGHLNVMIAF